MKRSKSRDNKPAIKTGVSLKQILLLLIADIGYALALNLFYVGNNIAAGGLAGIGTVLNYYFNWPIGLCVLAMTVPIAVMGIKIKGRTYVFMALITTAVYYLIVDLLSFLPCITEDKIVAVVFGGILYGSSSALAIKARMSTGGTDLLAKIIITKAKTLSIGSLYMIIDGTIVVFAMMVYGDIGAGIYAVMAIAMSSIVTDKLTSGFNRAQMFYIFADENADKITEAILNDMNRGVTSISGTGKFSNSTREILLTVVKPGETPILKALVHRFDPNAFVVLVPANEIIGNGFDDINLTGTIND